MTHPRTLFSLLLLLGPAILLAGCGGGGGGSSSSGGGGTPPTTGTVQYLGTVPLGRQNSTFVMNVTSGTQASGTLTVPTTTAGTAATITPGVYTVVGTVGAGGQYSLAGTLPGVGAVTVSGALPSGSASRVFTVAINGTSYSGTLTAPGTGSITGKIVDLSGTPAPTAVVAVDGVALGYQPDPTDTANPTAFLVGGASFGQGGYRLEGMSPGFHTISAAARTGSSAQDTGSTQVFVISGFPTTNVNIIVSPPSQQASVTGTVRAGDTNRPVGGAQVFLRLPVTPTQNNPSGYASLSGFTNANGVYQLDNVPVYTSAAGTTKQTYTVAASDLPTTGSTVYDNVTLANQTFAVSSSQAPDALPDLILPVHNGGYNTTSPDQFSPTITLLESFTQPNIPSIGPSAVARGLPGAAARNTAYAQIHRLLSPAYARLSASGHAAARVRRASAQPHATAGDYVIEMDLFFSLPGDTPGGTPDSPQRSQLYGFAVYNNINPAGDFLEDPLADFYNDPSLGSTQFYAPDQTYRFEVDSIASNGNDTLGQSSVQPVTPLEFLNLLHPADPNDTGTVETLPSSTLQWNGISRAQNYTVLIYSTFPGVSTTPVFQSGLLPSTTTSYPIPANSGLAAGQEYWVVVAATASDNPTGGQAISVSQITPFIVP